MVHFSLQLVHWLSVWYTTVFYWPTGYLWGTLPSPIGLMAFRYTTIFNWPTGYPFGTLPSPIGPLAIPIVHTYLLLTTGYLFGTLPFPIGPLTILMLHCYLLLAHLIFLRYTTFLLLAYWLSPCYTAIFS